MAAKWTCTMILDIWVVTTLLQLGNEEVLARPNFEGLDESHGRQKRQSLMTTTPLITQDQPGTDTSTSLTRIMSARFETSHQLLFGDLTTSPAVYNSGNDVTPNGVPLSSKSLYRTLATADVSNSGTRSTFDVSTGSDITSPDAKNASPRHVTPTRKIEPITIGTDGQTQTTDGTTRADVSDTLSSQSSASTSKTRPTSTQETPSTSDHHTEGSGSGTTDVTTSACDKCQFQDSTFGTHGVVAFSVTLSLLVLTLYGMCMVVAMPKILAKTRSKKYDTNGAPSSSQPTGTKGKMRPLNSGFDMEPHPEPVVLQEATSTANEPTSPSTPVLYDDKEGRGKVEEESKTEEEEEETAIPPDDLGVSTFLLRHPSKTGKDLHIPPSVKHAETAKTDGVDAQIAIELHAAPKTKETSSPMKEEVEPDEPTIVSADEIDSLSV